jgi:hypothetical protein
MQIKGKFIQNATLDSDKVLLKFGQALRILAQDGSEKRLIEINSNGKVLVDGNEVALKSDIVNTSASIESSLSAEVAAREAADMVLDGKITTEKNRAQAAEAGLAADIAAEASARQSAMTSEESARMAADSALESRIAAEESARAAGDTAALNSAKSYADQKVADLVNSAPAVLDTLKELADAIGNDASFATTIAGQVGTVAANLASEASRAQSAESKLTSDLAAEVSARQAAVSSEAATRAAAVTALENSIASEASARATAVNAEKARAEAAEASLSADIASARSAASNAVSSEQTRAQNAEAAIASDLSAEVSRATAAEGALAGRLTTIEGSGAGSIAKALQDAKDYTDAAKSSEQSRAQGVEAGLNSRLTTAESGLAQEITNRAAAITSVEGKVSSEETRAMAAESALGARLNVIEGSGEGSVAKAKADAKAYADQKVADLVNGAPAVLDTLKELADALAQDPNFATTVAGQIGTVASNLTSETSRATSAEAQLAFDIAAEETARAAAVSAEQARAEGAESALSGRVYALEVKAFFKEKFVLSQTDINNGFIEFAHEAMPNSVVAFADRLAIHQGSDQDFLMSVVGGKSRMTFVNNLIDPSPEKLSAGDVINVTYMA